MWEPQPPGTLKACLDLTGIALPIYDHCLATQNSPLMESVGLVLCLQASAR
jgi:hypothetical protein